MAIYLLQKQIQIFADEYLKTHNKPISLYEAVKKLYHQGIYTDITPIIDASKINFSDFVKLKELIANHPIDVTSIVSHSINEINCQSEDFFPFHKHSITMTFPIKNLKKTKHFNDYFTTLYVRCGNCIINTSEGDLHLSQNQFVIIPPLKAFYVSPKENCVVFSIAIRQSTFDSTFFHLLRDNNILSDFFQKFLHKKSNNILLFVLESNDYIDTIHKNIYIENNSSKIYSPEICMNYTEILFSELLRSSINNTKLKEMPNSIYNKMALILTYINKNFKNLSLKELAQFFNYDPIYLGRNIKLYTEHSFNDIINQYKIKYATSLLLRTKSSIESIADNVGYNSVEHFTRVFKKIHHCSPGVYRKKYFPSE